MLNPKTGKKWKVYLGLPSNGTVVDFQAYVLRDIAERYKDEVELVYPSTLTQRIFHDYARNEIIEEFLATDCDLIWFLDSDVTPPHYILDLVTMHGDKWECAGAPYPIFMSVPGETYRQIVFTAYKGGSEQGLHPAAIPHKGTDWVDGLATGCLMLKRELIMKLERPFFEFKYDEKTRKVTLGEDLGFCMKVNALGIQFFTDYSMVCKHQKNICLLEMNNYAVDYANKALRAYDASARAAQEQLIQAHKAKRAAQAALQVPKSSLVLPAHLQR